jgi:putative hydrolase of the HAD superfamily
MTRYLLWDFDGTLAYRDGMWSGAVRDAIARYVPAMMISANAVKPYLGMGFPWHTPEIEHQHISSDEMWWDELRPVFERTLKAVGVPEAAMPPIIEAVREEFLNSEAWQVADGAEETLKVLSIEGWKHAIISNHVPELSTLVAALGLARHFERIYCSAQLGVEKPNTAFFSHVLVSLGNYDAIWVIGDSPRADIGGARVAGLPSILIGSSHPTADYCVSTIREVPAILAGVPRLTRGTPR